MSAKNKALFLAAGITTAVILMLLHPNVQAPSADSPKMDPQEEQGVNEAIQG